MTAKQAYKILSENGITVGMVNHGFKIRVKVEQDGKIKLGSKDHTTKTIIEAMDNTALFLVKNIKEKTL